MAKETRIILINIPKNRAQTLEKFLKRNPLVIKAVRKNIEFIEVRRSGARNSKALQYEVLVSGSNKKAQTFIDSLFEKQLIPAGRKWMVFLLRNRPPEINQ